MSYSVHYINTFIVFPGYLICETKKFMCMKLLSILTTNYHVQLGQTKAFLQS